MRMIIKTTNSNPIPEIVFHGFNVDFLKKGFSLVNKMVYNNYKVTWGKDSIVFEKDNEVVFFWIIDSKDFLDNKKPFPQCGILIDKE